MRCTCGMTEYIEIRRPLELNTDRGCMKRVMEKIEARHVEAIHYLASAGIRVGRKAANTDTNLGFGRWY